MARTGTKRGAPAAATERGEDYVGRRVAKKFGAKIYEGTVKNFVSRHDLWGIKYDDDDAEEFNLRELKTALALHDKRHPPAKPPPAKKAKSPPAKPPSAAKKAKSPAKPPAAKKSPAVKAAKPAPAKVPSPPPAKAPSPPPVKVAKKSPAAKAAKPPPAKAKSPAVRAAKSPAVKATKSPAPAAKATKSSATKATKSSAAKAAKSSAAKAPKKPSPAKPAKPTQQEKDQAHVGSRVAKDFGGEVYGGTVKKFVPRGRLWAIEYDDGDKEEMNWKELSTALALQAKEKK